MEAEGLLWWRGVREGLLARGRLSRVVSPIYSIGFFGEEPDTCAHGASFSLDTTQVFPVPASCSTSNVCEATVRAETARLSKLNDRRPSYI